MLILLYARLSYLDMGLSYHSIDENDIVEPALGFWEGDLDMYWYKYGPLTSYILSGIYAVSSLVQGVNTDTAAAKIFFDSDFFYITARALNLILSLLLGVVTYKLATDLFGKRSGYAALILGLFPIADLLSDFKLRIDTLLALWILLTIYSMVKLILERNNKYYIFAGIFLGLALATKPLPALVLVPSIIFFHIYYLITLREDGEIKIAPVDSNIVLLFLSGFITNTFFNPYSILNFWAYLSDQINAVMNEGSRYFTPGWDITRFASDFGYIFITAVIVSAVYILTKIIREREIFYAAVFSYAAFLWILFSFGAARDYFYIPVVPFIIIILSKLITDLTDKLFKGRTAPMLIILIVILAYPGEKVISRAIEWNSSGLLSEKHTAAAAMEWGYNNIDRNGRILLYGSYSNLPKFVDARMNAQAKLGEYFTYNRWKNRYLRKLFPKTHHNFIRGNEHIYIITNFREELKSERENLWESVIKDEIKYIFSNYDLKEYPEFKGSLVKLYPEENYLLGSSIYIYKVNQNE